VEEDASERDRMTCKCIPTHQEVCIKKPDIRPNYCIHGAPDMPTKKKTSNKSLKLDFTGKMVLLVDLDGYGPMELRADDKELVAEVMKLIIDRTGNISEVNTFTKTETTKLTKYVKGK